MAGRRERREGEIKERGEEEEGAHQLHQLTEMRGNRFSSRSSAFGCWGSEDGEVRFVSCACVCVSLCASVVRAFTLRDKCGQHKRAAAGGYILAVSPPPRMFPACFFFSFLKIQYLMMGP